MVGTTRTMCSVRVMCDVCECAGSNENCMRQTRRFLRSAFIQLHAHRICIARIRICHRRTGSRLLQSSDFSFSVGLDFLSHIPSIGVIVVISEKLAFLFLSPHSISCNLPSRHTDKSHHSLIPIPSAIRLAQCQKPKRQSRHLGDIIIKKKQKLCVIQLLLFPIMMHKERRKTSHETVRGGMRERETVTL